MRCAPGAPATGVAALQQAGFTPAGTTQYGLAFVCRINSLPSTAQQACVTTPPVNAYWAYYHANKGATTWTYSTPGRSSYKPAAGQHRGLGVRRRAPSRARRRLRYGSPDTGHVATGMKIVSLLPSGTEIVFALGLGDALEGVTFECDHPPEARGKPVVSGTALPQDEHLPRGIDEAVRARRGAAASRSTPSTSSGSGPSSRT